MVEMALVLPLLILLVFGIIEFGRYYNARVSLTGAVREGARVLALGDGDAVQATRDAAPTLNGPDIAVSTPGGDPCTSGEEATVTAAYPFTYNIPPFGPSGSVTITETGVMRCGG